MNNIYDDYNEKNEEIVNLNENNNVNLNNNNFSKLNNVSNNNKNNNFSKLDKNNGNKDKKNLISSVVLIIVIIGVIVAAIIFNNGYKNSDSKEKTNIKKDNNIANKSTSESDKNIQKPKKEISIININSDTRPYAVMINTINQALPQSGLQNAYIVYELMVEGGITRMMALFKDKDVDKIGSVRSARTQYLDYVYENDAIYVHAGGAKDALNRIASERIADIDADSAYGFRDKSLNRAYEHTLFTSTRLLKQGTINKGLVSTTSNHSLLKYTTDEIDKNTYPNMTTANNVSIKYSTYRTSNYTYDETNKVYLRSLNNIQNVDLVTGEQYKVKNILIYAVPYSTYTAYNYSGYQKIDNLGSGEGFYITNGYSIPIIWEKKEKNSKTIYKVKDTLKELELNDGNTYIQIYPSSGSLTIN